MKSLLSSFAGFVNRVELSCNFGDKEDDYICDQANDKCHSSHIRQKFLEKEGEVMLDNLLRIASLQETTECRNGRKGRSGECRQWRVKWHSGRGKKCFGTGQDGHFLGDKKCLACDPACFNVMVVVSLEVLQVEAKVLLVKAEVQLVEAKVQLVEVEVLLACVSKRISGCRFSPPKTEPQKPDISLLSQANVLLVKNDFMVEQEKQTKWLAEMMVNNLPDQFSRVLSTHSQ